MTKLLELRGRDSGGFASRFRAPCSL